MMQAGGVAGQELDYASFLMTFDYLVLPYLDTKSLLALGSTAVGLTTYRRKVRGMFVRQVAAVRAGGNRHLSMQ